MFRTKNVWMVFKAAKLTVVEDDKGVDHRMAECSVLLEPFPYELAQELGEAVAAHCYNDAGALRTELQTVTLDPRVPPQLMTVCGAVDVPGTKIDHVEILGLAVSHQVDEDTAREWLKATIRIRFDFAPRIHREWLGMYFGQGGFFSFELEQQYLHDLVERVSLAKELQDALKTPAAGTSASMTLTTTDRKTGKRRGVKITKDAVTRVD